MHPRTIKSILAVVGGILGAVLFWAAVSFLFSF